jgi:DNA-binding LytR/AlgR family response regulator
LKIAICDDMQESIDLLEKIIFEYLKKVGHEVELVQFLCGRDLLDQIEGFDAVFLDIEMPQMDGFEVGKEINKRKSECRIIMATATTDRFKEAFKIRVFRYITKPFDKMEVETAISDLINDEAMITAYKNRVEFNIKQKKIQYICAYNGYVEIFNDGEKFRKEVTLKEISNLLNTKLFAQVNRSEIVGLLYVIKKNMNEIMLEEKSLKISRRRKEEFEKKYMEFKLR